MPPTHSISVGVSRRWSAMVGGGRRWSADNALRAHPPYKFLKPKTSNAVSVSIKSAFSCDGRTQALAFRRRPRARDFLNLRAFLPNQPLQHGQAGTHLLDRAE